MCLHGVHISDVRYVDIYSTDYAPFVFNFFVLVSENAALETRRSKADGMTF
jgi:hypothetical protein